MYGPGAVAKALAPAPSTRAAPASGLAQLCGELDAWASRSSLNPEYQSASAFGVKLGLRGASFLAVKARRGLHAAGGQWAAARPTVTHCLLVYSQLRDTSGSWSRPRSADAGRTHALRRRPRGKFVSFRFVLFFPTRSGPGRRPGIFRHRRNFTCISLGRGQGRKEPHGHP